MKDGKETKNKNHCPGKHTVEYWQREMSENTQQQKKKSKFTWDTVQVSRRTFAKNGKFEEAAAGMAFLGWTIIIII